jgi:hypothetical protein
MRCGIAKERFRFDHYQPFIPNMFRQVFYNIFNKVQSGGSQKDVIYLG